jgi:Sulfotransferase family
MSTEPAHRGFLFHRPHKVGSTTMVGIILRLVHNKAKQQQQQQLLQQLPHTTMTMQKREDNDSDDLKTCLHRAMHGSVLDFEYHQRDNTHSFLFSLLRHPTQRAISEFFHFRVATLGQEPTDHNFLKFLKARKNGLRNYYLNDMTMNKEFLDNNSTTSRGHVSNLTTTMVQDILNSFDFIAVTERMNESLVILQMLLGLDTKDIVYTSARTSGTFSNGPPDRPCTYIMPSFLTPRIQEFLASDEWFNITRGDLLLYQAANASLDRTIDALGRSEFDNKLQALERGLIVVEKNCKDRVVTLCTEGGRRIAPQNTTCYIWSEGCDHDCIDELGDDI